MKGTEKFFFLGWEWRLCPRAAIITPIFRPPPPPPSLMNALFFSRDLQEHPDFFPLKCRENEESV